MQVWEEVRAFVLAILILIIIVIMTSCSERTTSSTDGHQVKEVTKHTPTQDGGFVEERTLTHQGQATEVVKDTVDASTQGFIASVAPVAGSLISAATGTTGIPWAGVLETLAGAAITGYGALKAGQNTQLKQQVDFHKADADQAYGKLDAIRGT